MTTQNQNPNANDNPARYIPNGTEVISMKDGELGSVLNGFGWETDAAGNQVWTEYEVVTQYGIERWMRADFILREDAEREAAEEEAASGK
ncbi:MAG: hypothetical protein AABY80_04695 [Candidatus Deferrimicrobiota bacterium]